MMPALIILFLEVNFYAFLFSFIHIETYMLLKIPVKYFTLSLIMKLDLPIILHWMLFWAAVLICSEQWINNSSLFAKLYMFDARGRFSTVSVEQTRDEPFVQRMHAPNIVSVSKKAWLYRSLSTIYSLFEISLFKFVSYNVL